MNPTDYDDLEEHGALESRALGVILDGVKDHMTPQLAEKTIANDMWKTIKHLFEVKNENRKMALKDKLHNVKMTKDESVTSYLTRVAQVKDELAAMGKTISDSKLVRIARRASPRNEKFLLLVERNFRTGPGFGMILPKRRFEREL